MKQSEFKNVKIKPELHAKLKIQAVKEETSLYSIATKAFERYLKKPDVKKGG
jgi:predicted HicB family RNase H-like nuclease